MSDQDATSPVAEEPIVAAPETGVAEAAEAQGDDQTDDSEEGEEAPPEEELEEIELGGKKYAVPKAIKDGVLRDADYRQKTQAVAETRKALETRETELAQQAELVTELREDYGAIHALNASVAYYNKIDWPAYNAQNPTAAQSDWMAFQQAKDQLRDASDAAKSKETELRGAREREAANARAQTGQVLAKDIKGWGPDLANKLADFAAETYGVERGKLRDVDAATWRLIHDAFEGRQLRQKATTAARQEKVQAITPAISVKGAAAPTSKAPSDRDPPDVWLRKREAQVKALGRR